MYNYPRLDLTAATVLIAEQSGQPIGDLIGVAQDTHPNVTWYATAHRRITRERLAALRNSSRQAASDFGYPGVGKGRGLTEFDQRLGRLLYEQMEILPAEAGHPGVWAFMSLVLMPDVAHWRYPNMGKRAGYERLLGGDRNVFRRLWWRNYCLGPDLAERILEDEAVGIMERPSIGMCPAVARAFANQHLETIGAHPAVSRTPLLRDATKRLRRVAANVSMYSLTEAELHSLMAEVFDSSVKALASQSPDSRQSPDDQRLQEP